MPNTSHHSHVTFLLYILLLYIMLVYTMMLNIYPINNEVSGQLGMDFVLSKNMSHGLVSVFLNKFRLHEMDVHLERVTAHCVCQATDNPASDCEWVKVKSVLPHLSLTKKEISLRVRTESFSVFMSLLCPMGTTLVDDHGNTSIRKFANGHGGSGPTVSSPGLQCQQDGEYDEG